MHIVVIQLVIFFLEILKSFTNRLQELENKYELLQQQVSSVMKKASCVLPSEPSTPLPHIPIPSTVHTPRPTATGAVPFVPSPVMPIASHPSNVAILPSPISSQIPSAPVRSHPLKISTSVPDSGFTNLNSNTLGLLDPDDVLRKYPKLLNLFTIGRLAVRLSCESYFGPELLKKSTVVGCNNKPPLPREKVMQLKMKLLSLFPQFLSSPVEFEPMWSKCVAAINHCSAGLRSKDTANVITL